MFKGLLGFVGLRYFGGPSTFVTYLRGLEVTVRKLP